MDKMDMLQQYNYVLGTQTIGPAYQFTSSNQLMETANRILQMGSNIIKFNLDPYSYQLTEFYDLTNRYLELLQQDTPFHQLLTLDFQYYFFWIETAGSIYLTEELFLQSLELEYTRVKEVTKYLLETFPDKYFFMGHWEGDWRLVNDPGSFPIWDVYRRDIPEERIRNMRRWIETRQRAVDDAKQEVNPEGKVFNYLEVNIVKPVVEDPTFQRLVNEVLPHEDVDLVSYSCYLATQEIKTLADMERELPIYLDFIEANLKPKANIPFSKRVFIGEFGYPVLRGRSFDPATPVEQKERSEILARVALQWGTPFVLYWQMYDNECECLLNPPDCRAEQLSCNGFWMIDNQNREQPIYELYQCYHTLAKNWLIENNFPSQEQLMAELPRFLAEANQKVVGSKPPHSSIKKMKRLKRLKRPKRLKRLSRLKRKILIKKCKRRPG
ncbi:hypothetical protein IC619_006085 [Hazenella sp. IB182353]|uniref:hypothetical protein n=1 Tax=Polycladospora coralii TaxID=2771432 RepID=UPI001BCA7A77|nr:hypothetical protein [Polycladospora coralii]MBS7530065.1 hypothetical protein [Polycladospora coralii]